MVIKPPQDYETLRTEVSARYDTLSNRLRQIASFAWEHPTIMAMETTAVISKRAGVQPSALIRFAKAFGYSGFSEMQRPFQQHVAERSASYKERIRAVSHPNESNDKKSPTGILGQYCAANATAMAHLHEGINTANLEAAIDHLHNAEHIYTMGQRRSFPVASYLNYSLNQAECRAHLLHGLGGMLFDNSEAMTPQDVLIAISFSPYSEETARVVATAKKKKTPIIVITDSALNSIAGQANLCFEVEDAEVYSFRSLTASMCLAQTLAMALVFRKEAVELSK